MNEEDLRILIGEPDFSRGARYFELGKVAAVRAISPTELTGVVSGSKGWRYAQHISLELGHDGSLIDISGNCSCPVSYNCKHVTAVMLTALERFAAAPEPGHSLAGPDFSSPPARVDDWLDQLTKANGPRRRIGEKSSAEKLFYVFRADANAGALIEPVKARLLKSGGFGANPQTYFDVTTPANPPKFLTLDDLGILQKLSALRVRPLPLRYDWPVGDDLFGLLREVIATGRARGRKLDGPELRWDSPRKGRFEWRLEENAGQRLVLVEEGATMEVLPFAPPLWLDRKTGACGPVETGLAPQAAAHAANAPEIPPQAVRSVSERLAAKVPALPPPIGVRVRERNSAPVPALLLAGRKFRKSTWHGLGGWRNGRELLLPIARPLFHYQDCEVSVTQREDPVLRKGEELLVFRRCSAAETRALGQLAEIENHGAWKISSPQADGALEGEDVKPGDYLFSGADRRHVDPDEALGAGLDFAINALPVLRGQGWRIRIDDSWPFRFHDGPVEFEARVSDSGIDWFSFSLNVIVDGGQLDLLPTILDLIEQLPVGEDGAFAAGFDLASYVRKMNFYPQLDDGRLVAIEGGRLLPIVQAFLETHGLTEFHRAEAGRAAALAEALEGCGVPWKGGAELLELGNRLRALTLAAEVEPPLALKAELRPYQKAGYGWLSALADTGFGGALADDMGLGKTVQALALLAERHLAQRCDRPSLLVVPTSLVGNWRREAARFAPQLKLLILHGPERGQRFDAIADHHLVLTTYPLVRRDHETLFAREWEFAVLDEAQAVKNPAAETSKRIREIKVRQRIALTGTPMENNLAELWSLFDWLVPGLLGNRAQFGKSFRTPIEKHGDREKQRLLSTRVQPFLLRRTKEEVAADLPPKTEMDEFVPLAGDQRGLYETLRVAMDRRVTEAIRNKGLDGSRITILDALLKMRQVCCDPALVKLGAARKVKESAKRSRLLELLEELIAEGRKVLVFSQFVEMLKLIEQDVRERDWGYAMLTGGTRNRDRQIEKFQQTDTPIFLISLKAGGTGLNLTAADTVLLYDPWWNPAVERQAMDRAHRIGQDKPVFVHKLIAEGTVEAAIQGMQARKQALADALFEGAGGGPLGLSDTDIQALFAPVE
ncbi:MAG: DEAD/DEAH box helicase [Gammaproteobacteria bacterium]|nr:DEAD/DEAH box helicase [Gammaproteobacteria bacterium]